MYEIYCDSLKRNNFSCYDDFLNLIDLWQEKYKIFKEAKELLYELYNAGRCSTYCKDRIDKIRNVLRRENYTYKFMGDDILDKRHYQQKELKNKIKNIKIKSDIGIEFKDLLSKSDTSKVITENLDILQSAHPNQIIGFGIDIPIWKAKYSYGTLKGITYDNKSKFIYTYNECEAEEMFLNHVKEMNRINPHRAMLNVEIINMDFMGLITLPIGKY